MLQSSSLFSWRSVANRDLNNRFEIDTGFPSTCTRHSPIRALCAEFPFPEIRVNPSSKIPSTIKRKAKVLLILRHCQLKFSSSFTQMKSDNEATCHNPFSGDCTDERVRNAVDPWFRRGDSRRSTTINSFSTSTTINAAAADVNGNSTIKEPEIEIFGPFFDAARLMCLIPVNHRSEGVRSPGSLAERLISIMTFASCIALVFWRTIHLSTGIKQVSGETCEYAKKVKYLKDYQRNCKVAKNCNAKNK